ncbi:MAG: hypothetical protein JWM76_569 [Pseudonocardiales bacterium]|nr:hypothetical protein [Pseudonocardiales bacterium]
MINPPHRPAWARPSLATRGLSPHWLWGFTAVFILLLGWTMSGAPALATPSAVVPVRAGAGPAAVAAGAADEPSVHITSISPRLPVASSIDRSITFTVQITAGLSDLTDVQVQLERGNPLITEKQLNSAVTSPPDTDDVDIPAVPVTGTIAAQTSRSVVLTTTVDREDVNQVEGLCLTCNSGVYPVDVSLRRTESGTELARAHTFVPSFNETPQPVQVSWIWPLLDRPHRGASPTVFLDDDLAASVSPNGRLDRALRVAELVAGKVRLTLVVDPETIDALVVMSGGYQVLSATGIVETGSGASAARDWLHRLAAVAKSHDVTRTAYADPDVDTLARNSISWSPALDAQIQQAVVTVLGIDPGTSFSWPVGETLSGPGLDAVVSNGASAVVLSDKALPGALRDTATPDAIAPLPAASGNARALVLDSRIQTSVEAVTAASTGAADFQSQSQYLMAELAVRAVDQPSRSHYVVVAPARYVDTDPARTADVMTSIAAAPFGQDLSVANALTQVRSIDHGSLDTSAAGALDPSIVSTLGDTRNRVEALRECLSNQDAPLVGNYPMAIARGESSYWRTHMTDGLTFAGQLRSSITALTSKVRITSPNNASYTLASSDAPLFITVENALSVSVSVSLRVEPAPGFRGLVTRPVPVEVIPPGIHQFNVGTHVERTGRFQLILTLVSPSGKALSDNTQIRVKSTAFGAVALWITGGAFALLVVALILRTFRRTQNRRSRRTIDPMATPTGAIS